ncbi:MAG TPA: mechanosensitive ion channel family protein [Casimicrobiaceae bacterium]|nr:mechanosensitive ion channel family protein [Casimicrobiaceae bacterium]
MPTFETVYDAFCYTLAGILLALMTMRARRDLRAGSVQMIGFLLIGLGLLWALYEFGHRLQPALAMALREVLLFLITIGFVRIAVSFLFQTLLRKSDIPRILADVLFVLVLIAYAIWRLHVAGVNPLSLGISAGAVAGGIAFSLKDAFANIWGGIAVQLDNTARVGDWVRIENVTGQVIDIRLRYLAIATNSGETVIVPSGEVVKNKLTVLARRGDQRIPWRREIDFNVSYATAPSRVIGIVQTALTRAEIAHVAVNPPIAVLLKSFGDSGIGYSILYWLTDLRNDVQTDSQIRVHLHAALSRDNIEIPFPHRVLLRGGPAVPSGATEKALAQRVSTLGRIELFAPLTEDERRALATELTGCMFVKNDLISRKGETADAMFVLADGGVAIYGDADATGTRPRLATLTAPAYFGEMGLLTGQARTANVIAETDVLCYRLDKNGFDAILRARPELANGLSIVVAKRQAENDATLQAADADARARMAVSRASELVRKIRQFFDLAGH